MCHWCVIDNDATSSDTKPIPLPKWFQVPVDRTISMWRAEKEEWDAKRKQRFETKGTYLLSKVAEEKYQVGICLQRKNGYIYIYIYTYIYGFRYVQRFLYDT